MREARHPASTEQIPQTHERCACRPLSSRQKSIHLASEGVDGQNNFIPVALTLNNALQTTLAHHFPRSTPLSILLLHITQFEHIPMPPTSPVVHKKLSCHASASLLEQVLQKIRRTLRASDQILTEEKGTGAAILFPQVDQEGIACIAERISHSIHLLRAETIIPPLQYETEIAFGLGSYPEPATSLEELLYRTDLVQETITFRPAVIPQPENVRVRPVHAEHASKNSRSKEARLHEAHANGIPFMQLPSRLPTRLKHLIPHSLALELHCAPVGRDHNRLTVAMANPTDTQAIYHLCETTGMSIFPVSCEITALEILLASGW